MRTRTHKADLPSTEELQRLKLSPEVAWYLLDRGYALPDTPPRYKTPEPRDAPGAVFDPDRVDRVLKSFSVLRHTQGELAGQPLNPDPWQIAYILAPVMGWVAPDPDTGVFGRIVSELYVDVPRKNGKSTLSGGLALYLTAADNEPGAQVVAAASTKDQASFVFSPIKQLVQKSPALQGNLKAYTSKIIHPKSGSYFQVVSSVADAQHGANLHGAIIDELHIHKNGELVSALETGTGSRTQPLIVMITTADEGKPNTVYAQKRKTVEALAKGVITDQRKYGVIWAADPDDDPFAESTMRKANPGYGVSPKAKYLKGIAQEAWNDPSVLNNYLRLHLGIRKAAGEDFLDMNQWNLNAGAPVREEDLLGRVCYGGLDLGSTSDITALCWLFPYEDGTEGYHALFRFWTPEATLSSLNKRTADNASAWVRDGHLRLTPGNVTDYNFIQKAILDDYEKFEVSSIGFDRWNATQLVANLMDEGMPMVQTGQGYVTMSPALKQLKRLALMSTPGDERLHHGGNPVMAWMTNNLKVATDPSGNIKPDKANSADKIDGWSAMANAITEAVAESQDFSDNDPDEGVMTLA